MAYFSMRTYRMGCTHEGETDSYPWTILPSDISPYPARLGLRVRSGLSRVRVRVGSVGLGLVELVIVRVGLMIWVRGKCPGTLT